MLPHVLMLITSIPPPLCPAEHEMNEELKTNTESIPRINIPPPDAAPVAEQLSIKQWRTRTIDSVEAPDVVVSQSKAPP